MNEKINPGDVCKITEIGENDYHSRNKNLIGKKVMLIEDVSIYEKNHFQRCFVELLEDVLEDGLELEKGSEIYFAEVKLTKC